MFVGRQEGHPACKKTEWCCAGMVICLERDADLHMAQLMPLPLTVSCFSKIQIGFTFLVLPYPCSPGKGPLNGCVRCCKFCGWNILLIGCLLCIISLLQRWCRKHYWGLLHFLPNLNALVAISKGVQAVKLLSGRMLLFLTEGGGSQLTSNADCPV